jgi:predicted nucleotidyltransferase
MPIPEHLQPILAELKRGLEAIYGERLKAVVLFGSQARGDATPDSDVDVAVVLDDFESAGAERRRMDGLLWRLSLENNLVLMSLPLRETEWRRRGRQVLRNISREGVRL